VVNELTNIKIIPDLWAVMPSSLVEANATKILVIDSSETLIALTILQWNPHLMFFNLKFLSFTVEI
jgi:hypothetical protein